VLNRTLDHYISLVSVSIFPIDQKKFGKDEVAIEAIILLQNLVSHRHHIMLVNPIAREILLSEIEWRVYARYCFFKFKSLILKIETFCKFACCELRFRLFIHR
jgi:hypothetical protein